MLSLDALPAKLASMPSLPLYCMLLLHHFFMNGFIITYQVIMNQAQVIGVRLPSVFGVLCMGEAGE